MSQVAVLTHIKLPEHGGGIVAHAIRAKELAGALARSGHDARLIEVPRQIRQDRAALVRLLGSFAGANVVITPAALSAELALIRRTLPSCVLILDMFDAPLVGGLPDVPQGGTGEIDFDLLRLTLEEACQEADYFLVASEEQRLWLLGIMSAWGRLNPRTYASELVLVVPTGAPGGPLPRAEVPLFRGRIVPPDASVVLWPGGVFNHYRPDIVVEALPRVVSACPSARLVFVGARNAAFSPENDVVDRLFRLADAMNREGPRICFEPGLPYDERHRMYADADVAVCLFDRSLETELSFRTRLVDILWGGVPVVTNAGSSLTRLIDETRSGIVLEGLDAEEVARAVLRLLLDPELRKSMAANARRCVDDRLSWDEVVVPLHRLCVNPRRSADRDSTFRRLTLGVYGRSERWIRRGMLRFKRKLAALGRAPRRGEAAAVAHGPDRGPVEGHRRGVTPGAGH